jgi:hypothetical protein
MAEKSAQRDQRRVLQKRLLDLSKVAIFGTLSENFRECGKPGCRCHAEGPKHGPYLTVSYRSDGKTRGYSVPKDAEQAVREGIAAWQSLQECLRELAEQNKARAFEAARLQREKQR